MTIDLYKEAFEHSPVAMATLDAKWDFVSANHAFDYLFGHSEGVLGLNFKDVFAPEAEDAFTELLQSMSKKSVSRGEFLGYGSEGERFQVGYTVTRFDDGGAGGSNTRYLVTAKDETRRKFHENALQASEQKFRGLFQATPNTIIVINNKGIINSINQMTTDLTGYAASELIGNNISMLMPEPHQANHDTYLKQYAVTGHASLIGRTREFQVIHKDGTPIPVEVRVGEMMINGEKQFVGMLADIRIRKRTEKVTINQSKLAVVGEMAAGVGHDIKNPLSIIMGKITVWKKQMEKGADVTLDEWKQRCDLIETNSKRILELAQRMQVFARGEDGAPSKTQIVLTEVEMAQSIVKKIFKYSDVELNLHLDDFKGIKSKFKETCITQVLVNLIQNAHDAANEDTSEDKKWVSLTSEFSNDKLKIIVTNSGPKLKLPSYDELFHSFYSTKGRAGFGLSIAKNLIEQLGGSIYFSEDYKHTTVIVEISAKMSESSAA